MIYVDKNTLHLSGPQVKESANRHPVKSAYNIKKRATGGRADSGHWRLEFRNSGLSKEQIEQKIEEAVLEVEAKKKEREGPRKGIASLRWQCSIANNNIKYFPPNTKAAQLSQLKEKQHRLRLKEQKFQKIDNAWEEAKKELNYWNRMLTGAKAKSKDSDNNKNNNNRDSASTSTSTGAITTPTWELPHAEDTPRHLDLKEIFASHRTISPSNRTRIVTPWAEDPGVKTLSENVFLTVEGIKQSVNRFHLLQSKLLERKCLGLVETTGAFTNPLLGLTLWLLLI